MPSKLWPDPNRASHHNHVLSVMTHAYTDASCSIAARPGHGLNSLTLTIATRAAGPRPNVIRSVDARATGLFLTVGSKFAACTWQRRALGCCAVGAFPQTPGNNRIDRFLCHNSGARPKQWWSPLTHSLDQVVGSGGCSLIQSKESFRAAYLGAGGSLAMVDLEREVGRGQEERGADGYGRGRGGSSRMKHRSEEEVAAPNGGARASSGGAWTRAAR
jgi:hypothetical protein